MSKARKWQKRRGKRVRESLGSSDDTHKRKAADAYKDLDYALDTAKRVLRGGDCRAGLEALRDAERFRGQVGAHLTSMGNVSKGLTEMAQTKYLTLQRLWLAAKENCIKD